MTDKLLQALGRVCTLLCVGFCQDGLMTLRKNTHFLNYSLSMCSNISQILIYQQEWSSRVVKFGNLGYIIVAVRFTFPGTKFSLSISTIILSDF